MSYGNEYSKKIYEKTKKYQKIYGFELGTGEHDTWNNEADAFKHTFGSAEIALNKGGTHISKAVGDFHEWQGRKDMGQSAGEENMDKWNNKIGRDIANEIREKYKRMKNQRLQRVFGKSKSNSSSSSDTGRCLDGSRLTAPAKAWFCLSASARHRWVTINGNHVYID